MTRFLILLALAEVVIVKAKGSDSDIAAALIAAIGKADEIQQNSNKKKRFCNFISNYIMIANISIILLPSRRIVYWASQAHDINNRSQEPSMKYCTAGRTAPALMKRYLLGLN